MAVELDEILDELGRKGKYQIYHYFLIAVAVLIHGACVNNFVFISDVPKYRCFVPECEELANTTYEQPWTTWAIPQKNDTLKVMGVKTGNCYRYMLNNSTSSEGRCSKQMFSEDTQRCNEWVFDNADRTVVNDFKLTCSENQHKIWLLTTLYMAGKVIGSVFIGFLGDKYGRKFVFVTSSVLMGICGCLQVVSTNYDMFLMLLFIQAVATAPIYPVAIVLAVEMFGSKYRETAGIGLHYFQTIGNALLSPVVWYTRNWISTQLVVSVPAIFLIAYYWLLPESIRWLLIKKKNTEARATLEKIAKFNKVDLSHVLKESSPLTISNSTVQKDSFFKTAKDFFLSKKLFYRAILLYIIWCSYSIIIYSLTINAVSLIGNKYLNYVLIFVVGIPAITIATIFVKRFGARRSMVASYFSCGVIYFTIIFVSNSSYDWVIITVYLVGKFGITCAGAVTHIYTAEIFPTNFRSAGVTMAYAFARFAGLGVAYVAALSLYYKHLPMILLGVLSISSALLALILPETSKIPDTVEEADNV